METPAQNLPPEPTGSTLEEQLGSAKGIIADFHRQLSGAMSERDEAVNQVSALTGERDGLQQRVTGLEGERDALTQERDGLKNQVNGLTSERDAKKNEVSFLENYCKGHGLDLAGVDRTKAVKDVTDIGPGDGGAKSLSKQYLDIKAKEDAGQAPRGSASKFYRKNAAAIAEETAE